MNFSITHQPKKHAVPYFLYIMLKMKKNFNYETPFPETTI